MHVASHLRLFSNLWFILPFCTLLPFCPFSLFVSSLCSNLACSNIFPRVPFISLWYLTFPTPDKSNPVTLHQPPKEIYNFVICIITLLSLHLNLISVLHPLRILFYIQMVRKGKIIRSCKMVLWKLSLKDSKIYWFIWASYFWQENDSDFSKICNISSLQIILRWY